MKFEIHITVDTDNLESFKNDCAIINVKPIIIESENNGKFEYQTMTSSKYEDINYVNTLNKSLDFLSINHKILRSKVEIQPEFEKHFSHLYYESHFRLKLNNDFDKNIIKNLCLKYNFHLSKNVFKQYDTYYYQMITYRNNNITYDDFIVHLNNMKTSLYELQINYDKIEIEECIYDSNISIDNNWLNKNS